MTTDPRAEILARIDEIEKSLLILTLEDWEGSWTPETHVGLREHNENVSLFATALRNQVEKHKPKIRYLVEDCDGSWDSEQELLDSFTAEEIKEGIGEISTFSVCQFCSEIQSKFAEEKDLDEWAYLPEVYFPCPFINEVASDLGLSHGE